MADNPIKPPRKVSREELYEMVWQKPITRLAEDFGISGNGLAKICQRLGVPYPPAGYWAKKQAGKHVVVEPLLALKGDNLARVEIKPTPVRPAPHPEAVAAHEAAINKVQHVHIPDDLSDLHPRVRAWLAEHRKLQKEREQAHKRRRKDEIWFFDQLLPDLTERDLYRFRVTSAIFKGVERAGGRIESSPITGKIIFQASGQAIECSIVEKLVRSLKDYKETEKWTAYPGHHQTGLASSGFLRISITNWGYQRQWVETNKAKIGDILLEVVGAIMAAGPILLQQERERAERQRQDAEERERRYQSRLLQERDDKRWSNFCEFAASWENRRALLIFIGEIENRMVNEPEAVVADKQLAEWVRWAKGRTEELDPFGGGVTGLFSEI